MSGAVSFEDWLIRHGRHPNTITTHLKKLSVIQRSITDWTVEQLDNFVVDLIKMGRAGATVNGYIDTIRLYAQYSDLTQELKSYRHIKKRNGIKSTFSDKEIDDFLNLPPPVGSEKDIWGIWTVFFTLLAFTGARPGEIANLTINDVDLGRWVFIFHNTKNDRPRLCPIGPNIRELVTNHLKAMKGPQLFVTKRGMVFSDHSWLHAFNKRIKLLGIQRTNLTPYSFRHSMATKLLEEDVNIHKIAKLLGHDIRMTQQYEHLTISDIQKAITKHPIIRRSLEPEHIYGCIKEYVEGLLDSRFEIKYELGADRFKFEIGLKKGTTRK